MSSPKLRNRKVAKKEDDSVATVVETIVEETPKTDVVVVESVAIESIGSMGLIPYANRKSALNMI